MVHLVEMNLLSSLFTENIVLGIPDALLHNTTTKNVWNSDANGTVNFLKSALTD